MSAATYVPDRGDIVWIDFDPTLGVEQNGRRPAVVLSSKAVAVRSGLAVVCPITSRPKGYLFEVPLPAGLAAHGVVLCDHVKSLDWRKRKVLFICPAPPLVVAEVTRAVGLVVS